MTARQAKSKSQKGRKGTSGFVSLARADWQLPIDLELVEPLVPDLFGALAEYRLRAKPGSVTVNPLLWTDPPHLRFVNLAALSTPGSGNEIIDPKAMLAFSKRYGLLGKKAVNGTWLLEVESGASAEFLITENSLYGPKEFRDLSNARSQGILKYVWRTGDRRAVEAISRFDEESFEVQVDPDDGALVFNVKNLWTFVCLLLVRDRAAGKTAICANPDCQTPYFLKGRKDQKICEADGCNSWVLRQNALRWLRAKRARENKESEK
jgi:hypothetical protein